MKCSNCGKEIQESANFCRYCGTKVIRAERDTVPEPQVKADEAGLPLSDIPAPGKGGADASGGKRSEKKVLGILAAAVALLLVVIGVLAVLLLGNKERPADTDRQPGEEVAEQMAAAKTWQEFYALGQEYLSKNDYESAITAFRSALDRNGETIDVRTALAKAYFEAGSYLQALSEYQALSEKTEKPFYEERTQCYIALGKRESAGKMLYEAYLATKDESIQNIAMQNWDQDALHAYGEYVGYDGNYAFGLIDWNHDLTPELLYVWNAEYGNAGGTDFEIWTYQDGSMRALLDTSTAGPGGAVTRDNGIFICHPATNAHFTEECLYWDGGEVSSIEYLDCYLEYHDFSGYTLHPENNYCWEGDTRTRGSFIRMEQVPNEQYEQALTECTEGKADLVFYPVTRDNCKRYLDYDWDQVLPTPADSYTIKQLPTLRAEDADYSFGRLFSESASDPCYGVYAIVREDTGGIVALFSLLFDDYEFRNDYYTDYSGTPIRIGDCFVFELWYGPGMLCGLSYDAQESKLYELEPGYYNQCGEYIMYTSITFDTESPRTLKLFTTHADAVATLVEEGFRAGCIANGDTIYLFEARIPSGGISYSGGSEPTFVYDISSFSLKTLEKTPLTTVQAAWISDITDDCVTYRLTWNGPKYTVHFGDDADAPQGPALTAETRPDKSLYPRPTRTLRAGMVGEDVKYVQAMLITINYDGLSVSGAFDQATETALIRWQERHQYEQTGIVDADTLLLMEQAEAAWLEKKAFKPDFTFSTTDNSGATWTAERFMDYELTMLNRWAYWCGPCINELPDLQRLYDDYSDKGLNIVGIMEGSQSDLDKLNQLGITYPNLYVTDDLEYAMYTGYLPTTIFVDSKGHIVSEAYVGSRTYKQWAAIIDELLG